MGSLLMMGQSGGIQEDVGRQVRRGARDLLVTGYSVAAMRHSLTAFLRHQHRYRQAVKDFSVGAACVEIKRVVGD